MNPESLLHRSWKRRLLSWGLILAALILFVSALIVLLQRDQPPTRFTIVTGMEDSASYAAALNYQRIAAENGFELVIVQVEDVVERLTMMESDQAQVGIVPGGAAEGLNIDGLETLASVYYEPIWIFYRMALAPNGPITDLRDLRGMRIAPGPGNISTERLARLLLDLNGLDGAVTLVDVERSEVVEMLQNGELDAVFLNGSVTEDAVSALLADPALDLVNLRRAGAYTSRFRFLTTLILPEGVIDFENNLPPEDERLLSAIANVVVRGDLHPDLIRLLTTAVVNTHEAGGLFEAPYEFPNLRWTDLPLNREYQAYLQQIQNGESQLDNLLPFRLAALIDRIYLFAIPVLLFLIPVLTRSPIIYGALMRRRLFGWYQLLRDIEKRTANMNREQIEVTEQALDEMERRLEEKFSISRGYLAGYYDLRMHIALVREHLQTRREKMAAEEADAATPEPA